MPYFSIRMRTNLTNLTSLEKKFSCLLKCEGPEILPQWQVNCHGFMVTGVRHETPGLETKGFVTHSTASSMSQGSGLILLTPRCHGDNPDRPGRMPISAVDCISGGGPWA